MKKCPNCNDPHNDDNIENHCTKCYTSIFLDEAIITSDQFQD
jgi:hypothetical protein